MSRNKKLKDIIDNEIEEAFQTINLSLGDFRKILGAVDESGNGANFFLALCGLTITEQIAKLFAPYLNDKKKEVRVKKQGSKERNTWENIDVYFAVKQFYKTFFVNKRYYRLAHFIWDTFRNGHVHTFWCKKVVKVPIKEIDSSFLAGVEFLNMNVLETNPKLMMEAQEGHLQFHLTDKKRPYFRFSAPVYFYDLSKAVDNFKEMLKTNKDMRRRFHKAYFLLDKARRSAFIGRWENKDTKISASERIILEKELRKLVRENSLSIKS